MRVSLLKGKGYLLTGNGTCTLEPCYCRVRWALHLETARYNSPFTASFIPSALAYGPNSPSPLIPPNAVLLFEVDLVDFQ